MKKCMVILVLASALNSVPVIAQIVHPDTEYSVLGLCGYSTVREWYGGVDLNASVHTSPADLSVYAELLSSGTGSFSAQARPSWKAGASTLFLDNVLHSRLFGSESSFEFVYAASAGFVSRHLELQCGMYTRIIGDTDMKWHSLDQMVSEPFNLLYLIRLNLNGDERRWDIYAICSDFNQYEYERPWQPLFTLGGRYDLNDSMSIVAEGILKPSGIIHMDASFHSAWLKCGLKMRF